MTNSLPVIPSSIPYVEQILKINEQLLGLPSLPLIVIGCLVYGYYLKWKPNFNNMLIPDRVIKAGIVGYIGVTLAGVLLEFREAKDAFEVIVRGIVWLFRACIFGGIAGFIAIWFHRAVLRKLEKKYGWFSFDTMHLKREDVQGKPVADEPKEPKP